MLQMWKTFLADKGNTAEILNKWKVRDTLHVVHNVLRKVEIKVISQGTRVQYTEWGTRGCVALTTKLVKIVQKSV